MSSESTKEGLWSKPPARGRTRFVAEVSSNHVRGGETVGAIERGLGFVECAAQLGCSTIKFQQFQIDSLYAPEALARDASLLERKAWELPEAHNALLAERAHELGLEYSSTPLYLRAVELLEPHVDYFKVASYQLLWDELLREVARTRKPVVLSTGMATLTEVKHAVDVLWDAGCRELMLLHCVSSYPCRPEDSNLAAIGTLRGVFGSAVGWSDHSVDPGVVLRAVNRWGVEMVEFHLDLDGEGAEFSGGHCWLPQSIGPVIERSQRERRAADMSPLDGSGRVRPRPSELEERNWRTDPEDGLRPLRSTRAQW